MAWGAEVQYIPHLNLLVLWVSEASLASPSGVSSRLQLPGTHPWTLDVSVLACFVFSWMAWLVLCQALISIKECLKCTTNPRQTSALYIWGFHEAAYSGTRSGCQGYSVQTAWGIKSDTVLFRNRGLVSSQPAGIGSSQISLPPHIDHQPATISPHR